MSSPDSRQGDLILNKEDGIFYIVLNRPGKKNAITRQMYNAIADALKQSENDPEVHFTVLTGKGDYFSSGNDLNSLMEQAGNDMAKAARDAKFGLERYVNAYVDHSKPLIALVNGPAVGIAVTVLPLCDVVYATDTATFHTPFSALGQSPEACSSYTFPLLMGPSKANEMLMFGKRLTSVEAKRLNLISDVFPVHSFASECNKRLQAFVKAPPQGLIEMKRLSRFGLFNRDTLHRVNRQECDILEERWQSEECQTAIMNFFSSKL